MKEPHPHPARRKPAAAQWGGSFGYFSDQDGYLWTVASSS